MLSVLEFDQFKGLGKVTFVPAVPIEPCFRNEVYVGSQENQ